MKWFSARLVVLLVALVVAPWSAFPQAGSTGGTIGKTDKSASGGDDSEPRTHHRRNTPTRDATSSSGCQKVVGTWAWHAGLGSETVISQDGSVRNSTGPTGSWRCSGGTVTVSWSHGGVDTIRISPEGNRLSITITKSGYLIGQGDTFTADRK
jgi:hypothetical protein